jgi:hypothetical protein
VKAAGLVWYRLGWPREVKPEQISQIFRLLAATAGTPVVVEAVGEAGMVTHRLAVPEGRAGSVVNQLRAALPGLAVEVARERPVTGMNRAVELGLSTRRRPLRTDDVEGVSRAVLAALAHVGREEAIGLQWVLVRPLVAVAVPSRLDGLAHESWIKGLLTAPVGLAQPPDAELRGAIRSKQGDPGWRLTGRLAVQAGSGSRQRQLIRAVLGALRSAEAPGVGFRVRSSGVRRFVRPVIPWWAPLRFNVGELAAVSAWPVGETSRLPVEAIGSRLVPPTKVIRRAGRVVAESSFPGRTRPLALSPVDSLRHLHALSPTGSGKSTLLLNLAVQDMRAGRAVVVIEPKGDLIADLLERIPPDRVGDVVLLDPTDTECPVGLNPLQRAGRSPELVADQLLGLLHSLYAASWGPRTADILGASLLTLARLPNMSLAALPLLLTDAGFRRRVRAQVDDPIGLGPFWASFEAWSEAERTTAIAPSLNKLRPLLMRPELRAVIGQVKPRFDLRQVFTERKILLVNLARGQLGPETAALLGSLIMSQLWQAILGRSAVAPERRHPVFIYVDEFQEYLRLPVDFADALAQARGLGCGFLLANQYLHQLDPAMRSAVLANAQSRVAFRLPSEDARIIAAGSALDPEDFQGLGAFECYAQLVAGAAVQPWCSGRTLPPSQPTSDPAVVRAASRAAYGTPRAEVEADIQALVVPKRQRVDDLSPRRRDHGGGL